MRRPGRTLMLGVGLLVLFAAAALSVPEQPLELEQRWAELMQDIQGPFFKALAQTFNVLGRGIGHVVVLTIPALILVGARRWWAFLAFALTEAVTPITSATVKLLVDRPRPPGGLVRAGGPSFPSGHAAFAGATCIAFVLLFTKVGPHRWVWSSVAGLGIAVMAWSRTYLQVRWLIDVLAGSILGMGIALVVFSTLQLRHPSGLAPSSPAQSGPSKDRPFR